MAEELSLFGAMLGEPDGQLGRLLEGMFTAQVAAAMTRLGVPDQLAGGPLTAAELAARVGASADGLDRMLTAATAYGLVSQDGAGRYSLTPVGAPLRADAADSAQDFAVGFLAPPMWASIGRLAEVVRNPEPVNPAAPGGVYAYYAEHPEESAYFVRAMGRTTEILVSQLAKIDFRPLLSRPDRRCRRQPGHAARVPAAGPADGQRRAAGPGRSAGRRSWLPVRGRGGRARRAGHRRLPARGSRG